MDQGSAIVKTKLAGPFSDEVSVFHSNGLIWGTISQWCAVIKAPYFIPDYLTQAAVTQASVMKGGPYTTTVQGEQVFRWPPIAAALDNWHTNWMRKVTQHEHVTMESNKRRASEQFARSMAQLKQWGYELQERELQAAMASKMTPVQSSTGLAEINLAIQAIQALAVATRGALEKHDEALEEHSERLDDIEQRDPANRPSEAFVTIKQRCQERAVSLAFIVEGRMNLPQACGQFLQKNGAEKGAPIQERLDGSSRIVDVATWRRTDIDLAIEHYLPDFALPKKRKERDV